MVQKFIVVNDLFPQAILGVNFLKKNNAKIDYHSQTVSFYQNLVSVPLQEFLPGRHCAVMTKTTVIPGYSEAVVSVRLPEILHNTSVILEPISSKKGVNSVLIAACMTNVQKGWATLKK